MKLDLQPILDVPGASLPFEYLLDLSQWEWNGAYPVPNPVEVKGEVCNIAGALVLQADLKSRLSLACDRCCKSFERDHALSYEVMLANELENGENDSIVLLDNGSLDLDELLSDIFLLSLDSKNLCQEDCKGICPGCGADLNTEPCRCQKTPDPRLAGLAKFLNPSI